MKKNISIGFDGLVRAGKSSLIHRLAKRLNADILDEYKGYAYKYGLKSIPVFPKFPPQSYEEAINATNFFINLEKIRVMDLENMKEKSDHIILIDRTYLSCLAFDYAARHLTGFDTFTEVKELWQNNPKTTPDLLFYMDVSQENLKQRAILNNNNFPQHFFDPIFNGHMREFFHKKCDSNENIIKINANEDPTVVEKNVMSFINKYFTDSL
ncbi:hypothetical protein COW81_00730 [Candidatus Campbellbacteria bacterium CG22_combo_CG10-13_8_21_14_all_36_13]|uniref:Thymidylate kinase-like domain-containing protein n=1 Tax=Candidatus Campbellbacteria bacterium CG22_combo_CG10-13_8_21_14_all_36_13 TaxID=1974529 RepID=A0A2H0DZD5_9BACT|nr:MAG: hypothetical protein COW81_00730 [Candidatus Campbellbacteria bacterium CG22_combo_CG10-13_8_21_14_all_36_13]